MMLIELFALFLVLAVVFLAGLLPVFAAQINDHDDSGHNQTQV